MQRLLGGRYQAIGLAYEIELRRWPEETGYALQAGIDGDDSNWRRDSIKPSDAHYYESGEAIPVQWAQVEIDGTARQCEIASDDERAHFTAQNWQRDQHSSSRHFTTPKSAAWHPITPTSATLAMPPFSATRPLGDLCAIGHSDTPLLRYRAHRPNRYQCRAY